MTTPTVDETPMMSNRSANGMGIGMSAETANFLFFWGNWVLLAALIVGALATGIIIVSGIVKDRAFETYKLGVASQVAEAKREGINAGEAAGGAILKAAQANERAATLEKEAAQLRSDLEKERADRLPRTISQQQKELLVKLLSPERIHKGHVLVNSALDGEAWQFGEEIFGALKAAGFPITEAPFAQRAIAYSKPGLFLWLKDAKHQPKQAGPIFEAFKRVGILMIGEEHGDAGDVPDADTVVIAVSAHP